ncbi:hypothetical protein B0H16DRAFT_1849226 [Mycena metata]|uniref:Uncharacterized protein n=1 Tax=Mycena metata TaxID=1033252 RepID=A0AAD7IT84_9AGAR|nr:hypothetical protein B0H16DRAFT_1849226 [Mycena metata]
MASERRLRSASKPLASLGISVPPSGSAQIFGATAGSSNSSQSPSPSRIRLIPPGALGLPGLQPSELALLREKQRKLRANASSTLACVPNGSQPLHNALEATLIFTQYEAGSAVCIDPSGWVLTCARCFGDTEEEYRQSSKQRWLLFYTGLAVQVECRAWDLTRDLALLRIIAVECDSTEIPPFQFLRPAVTAPTKGALSANQARTILNQRPRVARNIISSKYRRVHFVG